ncbi:MAG: PASTA domain-containing protein [Fibrobacterota bacterium]
MKNYYKFEISRKKFWTICVPLFMGTVLLSVFIAYFLVNNIIMPRYTDLSHRNVVDAPELKDRAFKAARQECYNLGLRLNVAREEYSDSVPENIVMSQSPEAGTRVKRGRSISVVVSKGAEISKIPELRNLPFGPARLELHDQGFRHIQQEAVYSDEIDQGRVVSVVPESGMEVSREQTITVNISQGARARSAQMPNVVGNMFSEAKNSILSAGLQVGDIQYTVDEGRRPGVVLRQSVSPGRSVDFDTKVDLVVTVSE